MKRKFLSIDLLRELERQEYQQVRADFTLKRYSRGQVIHGVATGEEDLVYVIRAGRVRVYLAMEDKEFSLTVLGPGDLYATHTRTQVVALDDVELLVMPTMRFHAHMADHPALSRTIVSILGELLKQSFSIIDSLVFRDISSRLAGFLCHEARRFGQPVDGGYLLTLDLTMEQIGAAVGCSRQTASTIINAMERAGVLYRPGRGVYQIPDLDLLDDFSSL